MSFYDAFERALEIRGLKTADVCERTGLYASYFSKLKSGHTHDVSWTNALAIIAALGMTPDEFAELQREVES